MATVELAGPAKLLVTTLKARRVMRCFIGSVILLYRERIGFGKCEFHHAGDIFSSFGGAMCLRVELLIDPEVVVKVAFGDFVHPMFLRNFLFFTPLAGA